MSWKSFIAWGLLVIIVVIGIVSVSLLLGPSYSDKIIDMEISHDDSKIALMSKNVIFVYDIETGNKLWERKTTPLSYGTQVSWSSDDQYLAHKTSTIEKGKDGQYEDQVIIYNGDTGKVVKELTFKVPEKQIYEYGTIRNKHYLDWSVDTQYLAAITKRMSPAITGLFSNTVTIWQVDTWQVINEIEVSMQLWSLSFSPDGSKMLLEGIPPTATEPVREMVSVWYTNGTKITPVRDVDTAQWVNETTLVTSGDQGSSDQNLLQFFNIENNSYSHIATTPRISASFSPNGQYLFDYVLETKIDIYSSLNGSIVTSFQHEGQPNADAPCTNCKIEDVIHTWGSSSKTVAYTNFYPDSKIFQVKIFSISTGEIIHTFSY